MPGCQERGRLELDAEAGFEGGPVEERGAGEVVDRGRAGVVDSPRFLAHGDDAAARSGRGCEVDGGELGEGVADVVVDCALGDFAAFDVGYGNAEGEGNGRGSEHFVTVGDEQKQVWTPGGECVGQAQDGETDGLGHAGIGVGAEQALDARLDGEAVALDFLDGVSEIGRKMCAESKDGQVDLRVGLEFAEGPVEVAVVGAGGGDYTDAAAIGGGMGHWEGLIRRPAHRVALKERGRQGWACSRAPACGDGRERRPGCGRPLRHEAWRGCARSALRELSRSEWKPWRCQEIPGRIPGSWFALGKLVAGLLVLVVAWLVRSGRPGPIGVRCPCRRGEVQ